MTNSWILKKTSLPNEREVSKLKKIKSSLSNKLWVSTPEIKHFNDKINITIYVYNNAYNSYKAKLQYFEFMWGSNLDINKYLPKKYSIFQSKKQKFSTYIGTNKKVCNNSNQYYQEIINWLRINKYIYTSQYRSNILKFINDNKLFENLTDLKIQNYNYLIGLYNKELLYLKFRQKMLFVEFKYNELYLSDIIKLLQTIYNKKVKLNVVTLKYFWLSASILVQILTAKVRSPRFRGRYLVPLNYAMGKIKVPILSKNKFAGEIKPYIAVQNAKLNNFNLYNKQDYLDKFILTNNTSKIWSDIHLDGFVLSNLENKIVAGVFLKIAGRLTKRYKAERAVNKLRFKGTLKNVYSAHKVYSSSLARGNSNINVDKNMIHSNVRIGAFGLTGWIASY